MNQDKPESIDKFEICPQCKKEANWKRKLEWEGDIRYQGI